MTKFSGFQFFLLCYSLFQQNLTPKLNGESRNSRGGLVKRNSGVQIESSMGWSKSDSRLLYFLQSLSHILRIPRGMWKIVQKPQVQGIWVPESAIN